MLKLAYVFPAATIIILAIIIAAWSFFRIGPDNPPYRSTATQIISTLLPISLTNKAVKSTTTIYTLGATILEVKENSYGIELITDIQAQNLPSFLVSDRTKVYNIFEDKEKKLSFKDLKPKQKIEILIYYDVKEKFWYAISAVKVLSDT